MKHIEELSEIYHLLDIVESGIDVDVTVKAEVETIMIRLRFIIASTFNRLEKLEN